MHARSVCWGWGALRGRGPEAFPRLISPASTLWATQALTIHLGRRGEAEDSSVYDKNSKHVFVSNWQKLDADDLRGWPRHGRQAPAHAEGENEKDTPHPWAVSISVSTTARTTHNPAIVPPGTSAAERLPRRHL